MGYSCMPDAFPAVNAEYSANAQLYQPLIPQHTVQRKVDTES